MVASGSATASFYFGDPGPMVLCYKFRFGGRIAPSTYVRFPGVRAAVFGVRSALPRGVAVNCSAHLLIEHALVSPASALLRKPIPPACPTSDPICPLLPLTACACAHGCPMASVLYALLIDAVSAVAPRGVAWRDLGPCSRRMDVSRLAAIADNVYMQQIDCANLAWLRIYNIPTCQLHVNFEGSRPTCQLRRLAVRRRRGHRGAASGSLAIPWYSHTLRVHGRGGTSCSRSRGTHTRQSFVQLNPGLLR